MIEVGQKVKFRPLHGLHFYGAVAVNDVVIGKVVAVYPEHRWFSVEYDGGAEKKMRTSFNFCDIGVNVRLVHG